MLRTATFFISALLASSFLTPAHADFKSIHNPDGVIFAYDETSCKKCDEDNASCIENCGDSDEACQSLCAIKLRTCIWKRCW